MKYDTVEEARQHAQDHCGHGTLIGYDADTNTAIVIPMCCKRWTCPDCAKRLTRTWASRIEAAEPERFLTLTVKPGWHANPRAACRALDKAFHQFVSMWRKGAHKNDGKIKRPPHVFEYVAIWELQENGFPHLHVLQKGHYVPIKFIRRFMEARRVGFIDDIRRVWSHAAAAEELTKYLQKNGGKTSQWLGNGRLIRCSRNFFPAPPPGADPHPTGNFKWTWIQTPPHQALDYLIHGAGYQVVRDFLPDRVELKVGDPARLANFIAGEGGPRSPPAADQQQLATTDAATRYTSRPNPESLYENA